MSDLKPGMKVLHSLFGAGTVRAVSGSGGDAKITVDFSGAVGQKKLLASVANLTPLDASESGALVQPSTWYETLLLNCSPKPGRRPVQDKLHEAIKTEILQNDFWVAVRERLRAKGLAPRVLDDISEQISLGISGLLQLDIRIKHKEMIRPADLYLARAIFEVISHRLMIDFDAPQINPRIGVNGELDDANIINLDQEDLTDLPDRSPKRRPLPVTPKGVIKSRPKGREDY
jgi:hypothetical protein